MRNTGTAISTAMTHIAIQEKKDGKVVDWMEHVTDMNQIGKIYFGDDAG